MSGSLMWVLWQAVVEALAKATSQSSSRALRTTSGPWPSELAPRLPITMAPIVPPVGACSAAKTC